MQQKEVTDSSYDFGRIESESQSYYNGLMQENGNGVVREKLNNKTHLTFDDVHVKPSYSSIKSRSLCDTTTRLTRNVALDAPFIASPMDTVCEQDMAVEMWLRGGTGIIHRFDDIETQAARVKETHERITKIKSDAEAGRLVWEATDERIETLVNRDVVVSAAIGATGDYLDRAEALIEAGANVLLIDVAHGHHQFVHNALTELKMKWPDVDVIAGSIATADAAEALISWGADALRVGIGNGSMCETRIRAGVGVPQISALLEVLQVARKNNVPVVADGGIRTPGDASKAIATGASTVMLGSVLSGTKETPGSFQRRGQWPNEQLFKEYRGSASFASKRDRGEKTMNIEGTSRIVAYKGNAERVLAGLRDGLRSSMSYVGAETIEQFHDQAKLIRVSHAGHTEGTPHGLDN